MILHWYLARAILRPLGAILAILAALFASYCAAAFLSDAANGLLPLAQIAALTGLKVLIALEVLLPAALYVSVIFSYAQLHGDSEFAAMAALRVPPATPLRAALAVASVLAILVGGLSLFLRPWAYRELHLLSGRAATLLDTDQMVPGTFYVGQNDTRVIMLGERAGPGTPARRIFVLQRHPDHTEVISAQLGYAIPPPVPGRHLDVYLHDADIYELDHTDGQPDSVVQAGGITLDPNTARIGPGGYSAVAAPTAALWRSHDRADIAELQWRLSTPLSTLLLGLLGVPLARTRAREGRYARLATAVLLYFGYYLLSTSARTWVQHGAIPRIPGIWWVSGLLAVALVASLPEEPSAFWRRGQA